MPVNVQKGLLRKPLYLQNLRERRNTIKNAAEQTKCLYGRKETAQFPPNGFEIGDSFFIREIPVENDPFRRYVGICASGQSVKTALLRVYAIVLQAAYNLSQEEECKDYIDPYYKSEQLVAKLTSFAGAFKGRELKRNLAVDGRIKHKNEQIFYIIDVINEAINHRRKIRFQKTEYNIRKEVVLHNNGEKYTFSPYSLIWDGDFYYVVGYSDKYKGIGSHRVDRIAKQPEILDEPAVPQPMGFDMNKYIKTTFRMYNAPRIEVELICDNSLMDAMIDRFGTDVHTYACDRQNFRVIEEIAVGKVFFNWIFGFEGKVRIKAPENVKQQYEDMVRRAAEMIE